MIFETLSMLFVLSGLISAYVIFRDEHIKGNHQQMKIMDTVWILTGVWAGLFGLWAYYNFGRNRHSDHNMQMSQTMDGMPGMNTPGDLGKVGKIGKMPMPPLQRPMWQTTTLSTLHCGAGCTVADIIGEWIIFLVPMSLLSGWTLDYALALAIGIMFQYAVIKPMYSMTPAETFLKAFKIDFWSLTSWQLGMYGWMAIVIFVFHMPLDRLSWQFWFMMQIAMLCGFLTSYPTNRLLIRLGIKKMM